MTPDNRNNEPLDAVLRRAMRARPGPATPECADAESLAAYGDRSLAAPERERLEVHFADCVRCQLLLADIARADESARDAKSASEVPWYRRWRIAIPALAAVAAVLVFIAIRRPANEEPQRDQLVAMAKNEAPRAESAEQAAPPAPAQAAAPAPAPPAPAQALAMNEARPQALMRRESSPMSREVPAPAPVEAPAVPAVAPGSPPPAPASAPAASYSNQTATNEAKTESAPRGEVMGLYSSQTLQRREAAPAAPMTPQSGAAAEDGGAPGSFNMAERGSLTARSVGGATAGAELLGTISAPNRSAIWMIGKNGSVQRRAVDGAMRMQHSGVSTDLVAGSAPSTSVCWIVGRSGTIIRTTDGEHWELITAPSTDNLTGVSATSARDATITTAGGQSFATSDGGASWHAK